MRQQHSQSKEDLKKRNIQLVTRLTQIMSQQPAQSHINVTPRRHLPGPAPSKAREKAKKLKNENLAMLTRLQSVKSHYDVFKWHGEYDTAQKLVQKPPRKQQQH